MNQNNNKPMAMGSPRRELLYGEPVRNSPTKLQARTRFPPLGDSTTEDSQYPLASTFCRRPYLDGPQPFRPELDFVFHRLANADGGKINALQAPTVEVEFLTIVSANVPPALFSVKLLN